MPLVGTTTTELATSLLFNCSKTIDTQEACDEWNDKDCWSSGDGDGVGRLPGIL